ncbi:MULTISPECIES: hypothetical protein [Deinococcus]|uniref:Uncharacterized protein n=1 Tax=Deinococcus ruber TaxID=1848197 RepID=A0A918FAJ6_9DEIO|nr:MULTISPECIES: hypothetical protein [Deinococcus]ULH16762.1 hypothetical protein MF271_09420 [Deinococcus sp. KNUC1210]GGR24848.1 hypothetical protein GCM10008957_40630 [Deinococcus ruber]
MTSRNEGEVEGIPGEVVDEGTTGELLQDKNLTEDILRSDAEVDESNANDQPGFDDGRLGGSDGEDRQGEPNSSTGSDLGGDDTGGVGTERSGGIDGGPARKTPLPGQRK